MDICYVDESGSAELLCTSASGSTPVLVIAGLFVPDGKLKPLIWDFLSLKKEFNPSLVKAPRLSEVIRTEVKGANLRADVRSGVRRRSRRAHGMIGRILSLLETHQCQVVARVHVKDVDVVLDDRVVYGASVGWITQQFQHYLHGRDTTGLMVLDSRTKVKNTPLVDVITTQKFRHGGDAYPRLAEVPLFGHSDSHVALQVVDIVASAVLFPAACAAYCTELTWNDHSHPDYAEIWRRYTGRLKGLQFRHFDAARGQWMGGIYATGSSGQRTTTLLNVTVPTPPLTFGPAVEM